MLLALSIARARLITTLVVGAMVAHIVARPVAAVTTFKLPFVCGETYVGTTYAGHTQGAVDFNQANDADNGDPVLASAPGTVSVIYPSNGEVHIDHDDGWTTIYAHMSNILVEDGDPVERGQELGRVAAVGQATGAHLHFRESLDGGYQSASFDGETYIYNTGITSTNCSTQVHHDDIAMAKNQGDGTVRLYRLLFDGANQVSNTSTVLSLNPSAPHDRMVSGDFTNDGIDDVAFIVQGSPGYQVKVSSAATGTPNTFYDTGSTYTLSLNEGRQVAGDFDGD
jgi:hypothetical protein